ESFAKHFANAVTGDPAPIIEVSGRTYPVEVRYRPLTDPAAADEIDANGAAGRELDLYEGVARAVAELLREPSGDILVFLSGEAEIRDAEEVLAGRFGGGRHNLQILPLFGRLSHAEQKRVFTPAPPGTRKVVLATNVAETS